MRASRFMPRLLLGLVLAAWIVPFLAVAAWPTPGAAAEAGMFFDCDANDPNEPGCCACGGPPLGEAWCNGGAFVGVWQCRVSPFYCPTGGDVCRVT
jgi:hypothetical protein